MSPRKQAVKDEPEIAMDDDDLDALVQAAEERPAPKAAESGSEVDFALDAIREMKTARPEQAEKLDALAQELKSLTLGEFAALVERSPALQRMFGPKLDEHLSKRAATQSEGAKPGQIFGEGLSMYKVSWSKAKIEAAYPMVEFVPAHTIPISPHGVRYQLVANRLNKVPTIVRDIYLQWLQDKDENDRFRERFFNERVPNPFGFLGTAVVGFDAPPEGGAA